MARTLGSIAAGLLGTLALVALLAWIAIPSLVGPALAVGVVAANLGLFAGALLHLLMRDDLAPRARLAWIGVLWLVVPVFAGGAIAYLLLGKRRTARIFQRPPADEPLRLPRISIARR